jgi:hypothetical protein
MSTMKAIYEEAMADPELKVLYDYAVSVGGEESDLIMDYVVQEASKKLKFV